MTVNFIQLRRVLAFFEETQDISDKSVLEAKFIRTFQAIKSRSIIDLHDNSLSVRFSQSKSATEKSSNTVLSLKAIQPRDSHPILSVLVTKGRNYVKLINTSYIKKISHSSKKLTMTSICGSINYSDILKEFEGLPNTSEHIEELFLLHQEHDFVENLTRLVEATNQISGSKSRFNPDSQQIKNLVACGKRSNDFVASPSFKQLEQELSNRVKKHSKAIVIAGTCIQNVNLRGRIIETLVTSDDEIEISSIIKAVYEGKQNIDITTADGLADYIKKYDQSLTGTDIKTKVMYLQSAPKGFSIDKILQFLLLENTVFLFFLIGINENESLSLKLIPLFEKNLLDGLKIQKHWSGRNQRGHGQFSGQSLHDMLVQENYQLEVFSDGETTNLIQEWIKL